MKTQNTATPRFRKAAVEVEITKNKKSKVKKSKPKPGVARRKLPTRMHVGFRELLVRFSPEDENGNYNGACLREQNEIRLRNDSIMGDDELKVTLFHEYLHAAFHDTNYPARFERAEKKAGVSEEDMCQFFSACMMELCRDSTNWKILEWAHEKASLAPSDTEID